MRRQIALISILAAGSAVAKGQEPGAVAARLRMEKAWAEFATPNENHKRLGQFVGSWKIHMTFWPQPGAAPQESDGTAMIQWALGGRFIEQRQNCPMMGLPMSGIGYMGFDNLKRKYVTIWLDDQGTSVLQTSGTFDPKKRTIKTDGSIDDVLTHKSLRYEDALTLLNHDKLIYEAFTSLPDRAEMHLVMRIIYSRW